MWNWLGSLIGRTRENRGAGQAHMTFGQTSFGRTMSRTGLLLKKQIWIWPIIAVVLLATIGYFVRVSIQRTMEDNLRSQLTVLRDVERAMLEKWFKVQESNAQSLASEPEVRQAIAKLLIASRPDAEPPSTPAVLKELHATLRTELEPGMQAHKFFGFIVADRDQRIVSSNSEELIGQNIPAYEEFLGRILDGKSTVTPPFPSLALQKDQDGKMRTGLPTMFACVPVRDENYQIIAVLGMRIRPEKEFTEILQFGKFGNTGETYAIDENYTLVSNSRFDDKLKLLGLIPDNEHSASILNIQVRDPGGDITGSFRPQVHRSKLPPTKVAQEAVKGTTGVDLTSYRDYRGVPTVAAWTWLPDYDIGLITKIEYAEAFGPLTILKRTFYTLFALLALSAIAIFVFTLIVTRLQREAQKAAIEAKQLGQYRLEEQIGAGAMGVVYRGQHAMLRRPTAIKMLEVDKVNEASLARFEREVQITCKLNNPHTVAIYDFGRTPEGVFYYAMEYLDGINLQHLVEKYGAQSEARTVSILKQICASLFEAHSLGLVHRDIKPANVMLNRRGAEPDVVKVLDFGLVKAINERQAAAGNDLSGTPLYMSPEAIQTPDLIDARSDLYAVGAVGYFLLTGQTVFNARTLSELCQQHVDMAPETPSQRSGRAISAELEHAILACLEKSRAKRPQTARDLAAMLDRVAISQAWTLDDAEAWWGRHERGESNANIAAAALPGATSNPPRPAGTGTVISGLDRTIDGSGS
ncbi:serine/threonine protein kinase [Anatilimnocola sp. NA78]|uniref:serine/threonine protein kinase n=1 Tax=Anatilimnocola sp. NA78 TaxID=3415683 RepID=UPI003CE49D9F